MAREANIWARIEEDTKKDANIILKKLGLSMSDAIGIFLKQVVREGAIPFKITLSKEPQQDNSKEGEENAES